MQLHKIAFRGYKAFPGGDNEEDGLQQLAITPLTLVFGKNNSGKSAVVRLPRLLLGSLECQDKRLLPLEVRGLRYGGRFVDLVHGGAFFRRPTFELRASHRGSLLDFSATLYSPTALTADQPPELWSYEMREPELLSVQAEESGQHSTPQGFLGLLPDDDHWDHWRDSAASLLDEMVHLGPMRVNVQPSYAEEQPEKLGFDGSQAPQWLRSDSSLSDAVGSWFQREMGGWHLSLSRGNESFSLRVSLSPTMTTNLARAGEGLQQVLPVVVHQMLRQQKESGPFIDIIEHPDLHLHAAAQAPLADLFIETALKGRGCLLIETHSEPLLLRIQRRVAEGKLPRELVSLYYVEGKIQGSQLRRIALNDDGEVDWWPAGVFEEDFQEVAALRRAQRSRSRPVEKP